MSVTVHNKPYLNDSCLRADILQEKLVSAMNVCHSKVHTAGKNFIFIFTVQNCKRYSTPEAPWYKQATERSAKVW